VFFLTEYIRHVIIFNYRQENTYLDLDLSGEGEDEEKVLQTTSVQISDSADVTEGSNINVNNPLLDESNKVTTCIKVEQLNTT
jgi:hypothetical protein